MTVSVCMIAYNHEKYIVEAIEGVLMQETDFDIELIIANDASTDNTHSIITQLAVDTNNITIKYINHPENLGMIPNFAFALKACKGKYIALCDGDDYWTDPLKLQKQVDFLEGNKEYSGCFHNTQVVNEIENPSLFKPWRKYNKTIYTVKDTISTTALFHTSSFMFRRETLLIPKWLHKIQSGDMALFTIIASQGLLFRIDENMSVYRKNEGGITSSISQIEFHTKRMELFECFKSFLKGRENEEIKKVLEYHKGQLKKLTKTDLKTKLKQLFKM